MAKLNEDIVKEILFEYSIGAPVSEVMAKYGIGRTSAYNIKQAYDLFGIAKHIPTIQPSVRQHKSCVGVITDTHFPFVVDGYLEFCYDTFKREGVTEVVHCGDLVDFHRWSRHITEPDADGGISEFDKAYSWVKRMDNMFKEWPITLTLGNHDKIPQRQLALLGLPPFLLKSFGELFDIQHWDICTTKIIDGVRYKHGIKAANTRRSAERAGMNSVWGHAHSKAEAMASANTERLIWGMHIGGGFDHKAYAARYGEEDELKPIISCGTVVDGKHPVVHYMSL